MSTPTVFEYYIDLLKKVEEHALNLQKAQPDQILCRPGCSHCCAPDLMLFPIEADLLRENIQNLSERDRLTLTLHLKRFIKQKEPDQCPLLVDDLCFAYDGRPTICRVQGLPVKYIDDETQSAECDVCFLNFTRGKGLEVLADDQFLDMDHLNFLLVTINYKLLKETRSKEKKLRISILEFLTKELLLSENSKNYLP